MRRSEDAEWESIEGGGFNLIQKEGGGDVWSVGDDDGRWHWVDIRVTYRSYRTAVEEARDMLRRIGEDRKAMSDEALLRLRQGPPERTADRASTRS